mgnify:CR=1 FL=1
MGKNKESSMIKKMSIALISAFIVGIGVMLLKVHLNNTGNAAIWDLIDAIFFVDIREPGASGLGILFLVGQVFLKRLAAIDYSTGIYLSGPGHEQYHGLKETGKNCF